MRRTPLHETHRALGASFTGFAGWEMPVRYGSETAEHRAVRAEAGLFDLSHMGEIEVTGPDAGRTLDRALVGRPSAITPGRARYSMICAADGGIIDDLVVYRLGDHRFLVVANAGNTPEVAAALTERAAPYDAVVRDASEEWALLAVQGPASASIVGPLTDVDAAALKYYSIASGTLAGTDVLLARTGYTGEDGFEIYCAPEAAPALWAKISDAGRAHGLVPAGLSCRDTLRLEAGMPLYGHELSRDVTPFEANLGRVVAFDKPEGFVGDAALAARKETGPERVLVGLVAAGRRSPRAGYPVLDPGTGAEVGVVTSGAPSPTLRHPVAMAYVPPRLAAPGTAVRVSLRGTPEDATVVALPFYTRSR
ncbi:glycine cleavage system aminomethyltransferase GcvT [Actinocorallia sp. API 0066]|uniref:glycine cleavage system aminomethyltransferase GcvT n=1 Tax=Actinocorallia sp. API 0066 TaxID=2896846 RepID=UPI001E47A3C7|nr:glycine cleavage system aminomethyltransferase GcvT [Actinocorallia sp. API 0066]MCD0451644.1 glycine cleavage system aminomethyltransferase GcvT [Actinocorallia sp. API 0066]